MQPLKQKIERFCLHFISTIILIVIGLELHRIYSLASFKGMSVVRRLNCYSIWDFFDMYFQCNAKEKTKESKQPTILKKCSN